MFTINASCLSIKGSVRTVNQDNFVINGRSNPDGEDCAFYQWIDLKDAPLDFAVFDGVGGMYKSELASSLAVSLYTEGCRNSKTRSRRFLSKLLLDINDDIHSLSETLPRPCGTTAACVSLYNDTIYVANAGDSPIYLLRQDAIIQLSQEHTDRDTIELLNIDRVPELTQFLGMDEELFSLEPYASKSPIEKDDRILICSDGLSSCVTMDEIREALVKREDPRILSQQLVRTVRDRGGTDNITVIIIDIL